MLLRVGLRLPRVPLEDLFSIYGTEFLRTSTRRQRDRCGDLSPAGRHLPLYVQRELLAQEPVFRSELST
jgi:hypothetical protein